MANEHSYKGGILANGNGYIAEKTNGNGAIYYFGDAVTGYNGIDVKFLGTSALNYILWDESANYLLATRTIATLTGTDRFVVADQILSGSITTLSTTAFRAHTQLGTATIGGGAFIYGGQHKLTLTTGTINHADSRLCASLIQLDLSGASTYTAGQLSALWVDAGATSAMTNNGGQFNLVRISNTTVAVPNSVIYIYAEASYLFDLAGGPGGNADWFAATAAGGATRKYAIKVKCPDGSAGYITVATD